MGEVVKVLARKEAVHDARELARRLLVEGCMRLAPNATGTAVAGAGRLQLQGDHATLEQGVA